MLDVNKTSSLFMQYLLNDLRPQCDPPHYSASPPRGDREGSGEGNHLSEAPAGSMGSKGKAKYVSPLLTMELKLVQKSIGLFSGGTCFLVSLLVDFCIFLLVVLFLATLQRCLACACIVMYCMWSTSRNSVNGPICPGGMRRNGSFNHMISA